MTPKQEEHHQQDPPVDRPGSHGFTGTVNLELPDLIQMLCLSRADKTISVVSSLGEGNIWIRGGLVCHAQTGVLIGEPAFFEIIRWKDGRFDMGPFRPVEEDSIQKGWEHLLIEAIRQGDEARIPPTLPDDGSELPSLDDDFGAEALDGIFDFFDALAPETRVQETPEPPPEPVAETRNVRVLVVEDSSFFYKQLERMLTEDPAIEVAGRAKNGRECLEFLERNGGVDLLTLDAQMPVMQGDTTLKHIMIRHSIPALIISSFGNDTSRDVFEFLKLGAVDLMPKPAANEDIESYGGRLRDLVKSAARGNVTRYRRWRKPARPPAAQPEPKVEGGRILVVIGAEGAWMDWFRLPLRRLVPNNLVIGLQSMAPRFVPAFCRLMEEEAAVKTKALHENEAIMHGSFHLGTGLDILPSRFVSGTPEIETRGPRSGNGAWQDEIGNCLTELSKQAGPLLNVFCLSAAHVFPRGTVEELMQNGARVMLPPPETVICTDLIESVQRAAENWPQGVTWIAPENLMEVW